MLTFRDPLPSATKGVGTYQPTKWDDVANLTGNEDLRGVSMPVGQLGELARKGLLYNEVSSGAVPAAA